MRKLRYWTAALCAVVLLCGMALPAYAFTDESEIYEEEGIVEETPIPEEPTEESTGGVEWEVVENDPNPLMPSGTGTVIDNATNEDGKEFFVIEAEDGSVFYLVIDRQRSTENVYFLNATTVSDLLPLAELPTTAYEPEPTPTPTPEVAATFEPSVTPIPSTQNTGSLSLNPQMMMVVGLVALLVLIVALIVVTKRNKQQYAEQEDYPEDPEPEFEAVPDNLPENDYGFVWDEDT